MIYCSLPLYRDFLIAVPNSKIYAGEEFDLCVTIPGVFYNGSVKVSTLMYSTVNKTSVYRDQPKTYLAGLFCCYHEVLRFNITACY